MVQHSRFGSGGVGCSGMWFKRMSYCSFFGTYFPPPNYWSLGSFSLYEGSSICHWSGHTGRRVWRRLRDYLQTSQLWSTKHGCLWPLSWCLDEAHNLAATLGSYQSSHIKRKGNMLADKLAKLAKNLYKSTIWFEDIHRDVATLVFSDRSFLSY